MHKVQQVKAHILQHGLREHPSDEFVELIHLCATLSPDPFFKVLCRKYPHNPKPLIPLRESLDDYALERILLTSDWNAMREEALYVSRPLNLAASGNIWDIKAQELIQSIFRSPGKDDSCSIVADGHDDDDHSEALPLSAAFPSMKSFIRSVWQIPDMSAKMKSDYVALFHPLHTALRLRPLVKPEIHMSEACELSFDGLADYVDRLVNSDAFRSFWRYRVCQLLDVSDGAEKADGPENVQSVQPGFVLNVEASVVPRSLILVRLSDGDLLALHERIDKLATAFEDMVITSTIGVLNPVQRYVHKLLTDRVHTVIDATLKGQTKPSPERLKVTIRLLPDVVSSSFSLSLYPYYGMPREQFPSVHLPVNDCRQLIQKLFDRFAAIVLPRFAFPQLPSPLAFRIKRMSDMVHMLSFTVSPLSLDEYQQSSLTKLVTLFLSFPVLPLCRALHVDDFVLLPSELELPLFFVSDAYDFLTVLQGLIHDFYYLDPRVAARYKKEVRTQALSRQSLAKDLSLVPAE